MTLPPSPLKLGAVLFPGFELLDIYGPLELFGLLGGRVAITMVAERPGVVRSSQGPQGLADAALADGRDFDILLVPGGRGARDEVNNPAFIALLRQRAEEAQFVGTICTGSALLARTGLLDGRKATSNKLAFDWVASQGPKVNWIRAARWVEDGKMFTSSGVSAGMDMALALIQRIFGRKAALEAARRAEYLWHEDNNVDPFAAGSKA
jgi:putative intracellular protease/amidase